MMLEPETYVRMIFQDLNNRSDDDRDMLMSLMMGMCISFFTWRLGPIAAKKTVNKALESLSETVQ